MKNTIAGIHHITAIAGNAQRNYDFYTKILGLRMVKRTVNFDDPGTYHFYYGNENGAPGTILTFFPWEGIVGGRSGTGMATEIGYSVPEGSLAFWGEWFRQNTVKTQPQIQRFGEAVLPFQDPDGLNIDLIVPRQPDTRKSWTTSEVKADAATKGFHSVTLTLKSIGPTASILTDVFGYELRGQEGDRYRFVTAEAAAAVAGSPGNPAASIIDLVETPQGVRGLNGGGTNHHVAFRVPNEEVQMEFREKILSRGLHITPKINRDYFYSLYFREPGGVLFELATDNPGFTVDEPLNQLGTHLKLPAQYEASRDTIEKTLPDLSI